LYLAESGSSTVSIANTDISNNSGTTGGGGIYMSGSGSTLSLVNSILTSNNTTNSGGALYFGSGVHFYSDAITIRNNSVTVSGGAIYVNSNGGNIEILNSQIWSNSANSGYGCMYLPEAATSTVSVANTDISNNTGTANGGGIYISGSGSTLSLVNSSIRYNSIGGARGGGVYANTGVDLYLEDSSVNSNDGRYHGGGICAWGSNNFTMKNSNLNGNYFNSNNGIGGGAYLVTPPSVYIADSTVQNNTGYTYGGAIHLSNTSTNKVMIERSYFRGNSFQGYTDYNTKGGGIYFTGNGTRTVRNSVFSGNKARFGGGVFHNSSDINTVYMNTSFSGNHATESGGGIYGSTNGLTITNSIVYSNAADTSNNNIRGTHTVSYTNDGDAMLDCTPGDNPNNNMTCTPSFVSPLEPSSAPTTSGDYHLQSGSSCIDTGTSTGAPSDDIDGDTRSGSIDMGADEYVP
jgi:predicted outer membrane repeat protein